MKLLLYYIDIQFYKILHYVRICVDFGCLGREILPQNLKNIAPEFRKLLPQNPGGSEVGPYDLIGDVLAHRRSLIRLFADQ